MNLHYFEEFINEQYENKLISIKHPNTKGDVMVCCPFPHKKTNVDANWNTIVSEYHETVPSAGINLDKRVFNCLVCGEGHNELSFATKVSGKPESDILKSYAIVEDLKSESQEWCQNQHKTLLNNSKILDKLEELTISKKVIDDLKLGYITEMLAIPCFKNNQLVDIVRYNINKIPDKAKVLRNAKSLSGNIIPFDIWKSDKAITVICEGEKDMLVARSHGFNAISITGGAQFCELQSDYLKYFKDRKVYIVYDNDEAGRNGANKLYKVLSKITIDVLVTDISTVCAEEKEDVADFFLKYKKTEQDFKDLLESHSAQPSEKTLKEIKTKQETPSSKISDNIKHSILKKLVKSKLQIIATCSEMYAVPDFAEFTPPVEEDKGGDLIDSVVNKTNKNKPKHWLLKDNLENFLEFIEKDIKQKDIMRTFARILRIPVDKAGEPINYKFTLGKLKTVYKVTVADEVIENDDYVSEITVDLYTFEPLDIGTSYEIEYKLFPHPKDGQKLIAVATNINKPTDDLENLSDEFKTSLDRFKIKDTVVNKVDELYKSAKVHIAPYLNKDLWLMCDLVFNSPLDITYIKPLRGALDVFILGDTRTGKSETSRALRELYDFGSVVPLKTATTQSLIGGTNEKDKKTKLGILPREHTGLVILEEFSGAPMGFTKTMTEIRSSSIVKLYRVASGELKAPCKLRMITISNATSSDDGFPRLLSIFPNGVEPIIELVNSPEDVARYDAFMLVPRVTERLNPFDHALSSVDKIDKKHYENKIKWVRSLKAPNIIINDEVGNYIFQKSVLLNDKFESNFTLFGSETDKKLARFCSALAVMLVSTDETYKQVIVTKEHVDYIYEFFLKIYDNEYFRLREYSEEQKAYSVVVEEDTNTLQSIYPRHVTIIDLLANKSRTNRNEMQIASGQDRDEFSKFFNMLVSRKFIKLARDQIMPTEKFRATYKRLNKSFNLGDVEKTVEAVTVPF